jgi:hypothetical protein
MTRRATSRQCDCSTVTRAAWLDTVYYFDIISIFPTWSLSEVPHGHPRRHDPGCGIDNDRIVRGQPEELQMTAVRTKTVRQIAATLAVATSLAALASPDYSFTAEAQR